MSVVVECPNGHRLQAHESHLGKTITCPQCNVQFVATAAGGSGGGGLGSTGFGALIRYAVALPCLALGIMFVIFGRGCDSISMRSVARSYAYVDQLKLDAEKDEKKIDQKKYKRYLYDARTAQNAHMMWAYWYQIYFILGSFFLMVGLLALAFTAQGAEKWVAYIMIAIITFSIYVGGFAWVESLVTSAQGGMQSVLPRPTLPKEPLPPFKP